MNSKTVPSNEKPEMSHLSAEEIHEHRDSCGCDHHHHHEHGDSCGCEHEHHHEHSDSCGCEHHHHGHGDSCGCDHHHHHEHGDSCGCDHHHEHGDSCGCEHHHHEHDNSCGCEHHHHEHDDSCGCGHEHHKDEHKNLSSAGELNIYTVEHMDCANCAAKVERLINQLDSVDEAVLTYSTKQLRVWSSTPQRALADIKAAVAQAEPEWEVVVPDRSAGELNIYTVEHMDCANCAAKVERLINQLDSVDEAVLTYSTKQLRVWSATPQRALADIKAAVAQAEPEWEVVVPASANAQKTAGEEPENSKDIPVILMGGAALLAVLVLTHGVTAPWAAPASLVLCLLAYLLVGGGVLRTAFHNLTRGQVFDENFLMCVATIGAFAIGEYPEALGVMLFYRIGEYFEDKAVARSRSHIMEALDLRPEVVTLVREGVETVIPAEEARVGDLIRVHPGDRIPLDGTVISGESEIDTSAVTGEPVPEYVMPGDAVISGCVNNTGLLTIRAEAVLAESMVSRILNSVENAAAGKPQIDRFITRFARIYTPAVVVLALLVAVVPSLVSGNWLYWVKTACTFLVISCPCALVLSVPLAFFAGIGAASGEQILFKGGSSLEVLKGVKAVVMDKTGTLTQGTFQVQSLEPAQGVEADDLLVAAASCEMHSTHPIARSILDAAGTMILFTPRNVREIAGKGICAEHWLCGNPALLEENGVVLPPLPLRPGQTQVLVARHGEYYGRILISDIVKPGSKEAVAQLKQLGMTSVMLTGDREEGALSVAEQVGISEVHARLLPQEKLSALEQVRKEHGAVLFVGDGINDAPVLAGADVGGAMGSGADAAIEAADVVFMTNEPTAIPKAIRIARTVNRIARENVVFALSVKAAVLVLGLCHLANMWFAVFADTGVAMICIANSIRILHQKH